MNDNIKRYASEDYVNKKIVQSDWNQNDETASDFVKNRTHSLKIEETVLVDYSTDSPVVEDLIESKGYCSITLNIDLEEAFKNDIPYTVTINGVTETTYKRDSMSIGNINIFISSKEDTGESFYASTIGTKLYSLFLRTVPSSLSIKITYQKEIIALLDEKYISYKPGKRIPKGEVVSILQPDGTKTDTIVNVETAEAFNLSNLSVDSKATGSYSHAEGKYTTAYGSYSHAEGQECTAYGDSSHAEGFATYAASDCQHVQGKRNIVDTNNKFLHIVGNGTLTENFNTGRSNAHTLDWNGNAWYAGDVYVGSTSGTNKDEGSKKLATEDYVNTIIASSTPNTSFGITGASVGQTIRITAVDENGVPTAWEPVDLVLKSDFDAVIGSYITDINTLVGGDA